MLVEALAIQSSHITEVVVIIHLMMFTITYRRIVCYTVYALFCAVWSNKTSIFR